MKWTKQFKYSVLAPLLTLAVLSSSVSAQFVSESSGTLLKASIIEFNLPQNDLAKTLVDFGIQANIAVIVPYELVKGYTSSPIVGSYTLERALDKILWRAPLSYHIEVDSDSQSIVIQKKLDTHTSNDDQVQAFPPLSPVEEFVVTGIRASLKKSINIKRYSDGVIDAISAEDIGKFPDTNLAESLQRLSGVSISRSNGEGSKVTVRGFGETYNLVTLNGRTMPTASAPANDVANTRAFDFANIASEGIRGVDVYKTSNAAMATGGIGATIDIRTFKPFDEDGFHSHIGMKALADTTNRTGRDVTPEASALLSWADRDAWGVSFFGSLQERDSGSSGAFVDQWKTTEWLPLGQDGSLVVHNTACADIGGNPLQDQCSTVVNPPQNGQLYSLPSQLHYTITDSTRSRLNSQITLQFKPAEFLTASVDYTYSNNSIEGVRAEQALSFTDNRSYVEFDNGIVKTPESLVETLYDSNGLATAKGIAFAQQAFDAVNTNTSLGVNFEFTVNDQLKIIIDGHSSSAKSGPGDAEFGSLSNVSIGANVVGTQAVNWRRDLPIMDITVNDTLLAPHLSNDGVFDARDMGTQVAFAYFSQQQTDIDQIQLHAVMELETLSVEMGMDVRNMESHTLYSDTYYTMGDWGITDPSSVPDEFFSPRNFADEFSDYNTEGMYEGGFDADQKAITDWAVTEYVSIFPQGFIYTDRWKEDRTIKEGTLAGYGQVVLEFNTGDVPSRFIAGLRYEETTVDSVVKVIPTEVVWLDNNDFVINYSNGNSTFLETAHYSNTLPNLELTMDVSEDFKTRLAYSKTLARVAYDQLSASVSGLEVSGVTVPGQINAVALSGNPHLKPLESDNFDISLEYYLNDLSYVSLGAYWKKIDNFVGISPGLKTQFDLRDSTSGPRAQAATAVIEADPGFDGTVTPKDLFNQIAATENNDLNPNGDESYYGDTYDIRAQADDPLYQVNTFSPVNNKNARISGLEFSAQHFWGESGFGFMFNYTTVNGDVAYDNNAQNSVTQFALLGLSDSMNAVAMYEKYGLQARLAYNWRDDFLAYLSEEPVFVEAYSQVDLILSYEFSDHLSLSFEGLNITEENSRQHGRTHAQLVELEQLGARYMLGLRFVY